MAVEALLRVEKLPPYIWEPACGSGRIVKVLRKAGYQVLATDLVDYGCPDSEDREDFLFNHGKFPYIDAIVTNPPFMLAEQFVARALTIGIPLVIMLLRLAFLESERRSDILDGGKLARVHVFRNRLPMMHRVNYEGPKSSSAMSFAWFVWSLDHTGPTTIDRISWEK